MNDLKRFAVTDQKLMVVYIAGPMSGLPQYNYPAFWYAANTFKTRGIKVLNPADLPKLDSWQSYMRESLKMLAQATHVYFLDGWESSKGARTEFFIARNLELVIIDQRPCAESSCDGCAVCGESCASEYDLSIKSACPVCANELTYLETLTKCYACHALALGGLQ